MLNIKLFFKNLIKYLEVVSIPSLIILLILIPILSCVTTFILDISGISYISYTNIKDILLNHPIALLGLLTVFSIVIITVFLEFTFLLLSVYYIRMDKDIKIARILALTVDQISKVSPGSFVFFIFYFLLILPFSGLGYTTALLSKAAIPNFIIDYIFEGKFIFIALLAIFYIAMFYIAIRLVLVLPLLILKKNTIKSAVVESWYITKGKILKIIFKFMSVVVVFVFAVILVFFLIYQMQVFFDNNLPDFALYSAVVSLLFIQLIAIVLMAYVTVYFFEIILEILFKSKAIKYRPNNSLKYHKDKYNKIKIIDILIRISVLIIIAGVLFFNFAYMQGLLTSKPMTISHRGVSLRNGVQNTIESLNTIVGYSPDYVEMDIQETKDHKFVVMHDKSLKKLAGLKVNTSKLTLKELEKITIRENGFEAKIPSFDDYLKEAKLKNQKLLIEIKTNKFTSDDIVDLFIKRYKENILENKHIVQSLDYKVVTELKEKSPELNVGYILPYNLAGMPSIRADFFTVEYTSIEGRFVNKAHKLGKKVFVWTVNDEEVINNMIFLNVDGIITDNMTLLNRVIEDETNSPTYANRLISFIFELIS